MSLLLFGWALFFFVRGIVLLFLSNKRGLDVMGTGLILIGVAKILQIME